MMPNGEWVRLIWVKLERILDRRTWFYYLIIPDPAAGYWAEQIEVRPDERFFQVLAEHVDAYVHEGKIPPKMIASAVMNVADDFMADRDIVLRAGDYIAVQNFMREKA
jgi:hypothetical protein